jgi:hypothetical protein
VANMPLAISTHLAPGGHPDMHGSLAFYKRRMSFVRLV